MTTTGVTAGAGRARTPDARRRAVTATVAVLALALVMGPSWPAAATHEELIPRGIERACPPDHVPDPGFADISDTVHQAEIACIAWWEVTRGRTATTYAPVTAVRRDQMASFIARKLDIAGVDVPWNAAQAFPDVSPANAHYEAVNALSALGVVVGHDDGTYRPKDPVRRDQMASFISRSAEHSRGAVLTDDHQWFHDVAEANVHFSAVNGLAAVGIVAGRDAEARIYAPRMSVGRAAMASFLARTLDLLAEEGIITPPEPPVGARASLVDVDGDAVGEVTFAERPDGRVEVAATVADLPPGGFHGFHIHQTGACEPDFAAAGGHYNPDGRPHGEHAGDLPVLLVTDDGAAEARFVTDRVTVDGLLAGDGTAAIIHALPDNYAHIPERYAPDGPDEITLATGDAGARIACGVVEAAGS